MELLTRWTVTFLLWFLVAALPFISATANCSDRPDTGPCLNKLARWAYDPGRMACVPFTYGGCGGNTNKFLSLLECTRICKSGRFFAARSRRKWLFARAGASDENKLRWL